MRNLLHEDRPSYSLERFSNAVESGAGFESGRKDCHDHVRQSQLRTIGVIYVFRLLRSRDVSIGAGDAESEQRSP